MIVSERYDKWHRKTYRKYDTEVDRIKNRMKEGSPQLLKVFSIIRENSSVIDLGCGDASLLYLLKKQKHCDALGIDFSKFHLKLAKSRGIKILRYDIENDNINIRQKYDYVICTEVLEHLYEPMKVLMKARSLLKEDGFLIITTPNIGFLYHRIKLIFGRYPSSDPEEIRIQHIHLMVMSDLKRYFRDSKWNILNVKGTMKTFHNPILSKVTSFLADFYPSLFASRIIVYAEKGE